MDANEKSATFEIDLKERGGRFSFSTGTELEAWCTGEPQHWIRWLEKVDALNESVPQLRNAFGLVNGLAQEWSRCTGDPHGVADVHRRLRAQLEQMVGERRVLLSNSPEGRWVLEIKKTAGDLVAAGAYAGILGHKLSPSYGIPAGLIDGLIEAFLLKREVNWTATAHHAELIRLRNEYDGGIQKQAGALAELQGRNDSLNGLFKTTLNEQSDKLTQLNSDIRQEFERSKAKLQKDLEALKEFYSKELALKSPVEYWTTRTKVKTGEASNFLNRAVKIGVGVIAGLVIQVWYMLSGLAPDSNPKSWQLGVLAITAFFGIWAIRIPVRIYLSNLHLAADASEREMMIKTYLSLIREGHEFDPKDRSLMLSHIFRSSSDGLVRDDAAPPTPLEVITRRH